MSLMGHFKTTQLLDSASGHPSSHGNMAVTEVLIRLQIARSKLPAPIDPNLSAVDLRSGRIAFVQGAGLLRWATMTAKGQGLKRS
jgi:hypothetical protein